MAERKRINSSPDLNSVMLSSARKAMGDVKASAIMLFADTLEDISAIRKFAQKKKLILITQKDETEEELKNGKEDFKAILKLPKVKLTRMGQVKLSTIICITEGVIKADEKIVCLTGVPGNGYLDCLFVFDLMKESEVFAAMDFTSEILKKVKPEVLETVLTIAIDLAGEGREGKAVGTTFVIGDNERVEKLSRPLIMNPFKGYPEESRNILDSYVHETIKEFSLLDGAIIIRGDGVVMGAGVHLDAALNDEGKSGHMPGLGCRHMAAAGITDVTDAIAITISGSTGIVRIFRKGKVMLEIERPIRNNRSNS